jgi:hypothetical protein
MASDQALKRSGEAILLRPYFIGITEGKYKGKPVKHVHYVMIKSNVAVKIGLTKKYLLRDGSDSVVDGVVFRNVNKRKNSKSKTGVTTAKRGLHQYSKSITVILDKIVKSKDGLTTDFESYDIGFPSSVPLRMIIKFFRDNCPKVMRIKTKGNMYGVR